MPATPLFPDRLLAPTHNTLSGPTQVGVPHDIPQMQVCIAQPTQAGILHSESLGLAPLGGSQVLPGAAHLLPLLQKRGVRGSLASFALCYAEQLFSSSWGQGRSKACSSYSPTG